MSAVRVTSPPTPAPPPRPPAPPRAVLLDVASPVRAALGAVLCELGYDVAEAPTPDEALAGAALVVVQGGRGPAGVEAAHTLRRQTGGPIIVGVVAWWSEQESDISRVSDAVLHVPLRRQQLEAILAAFPGRLPPPSVASHVRAS